VVGYVKGCIVGCMKSCVVGRMVASNGQCVELCDGLYSKVGCISWVGCVAPSNGICVGLCDGMCGRL
jgi:hypothetical protein